MVMMIPHKYEKSMKLEAEEMLDAVYSDLEQGRRVSLRASGGSMRPFVMAGDVVVLERRASYETDDIVLAMTDHGVMLHAMMPDGRVMGTANVQRRERVVMVAGKVTSVERGGKVRSTEGRGWRMMMAAWRVCLPVRRVLMKIVNMRER